MAGDAEKYTEGSGCALTPSHLLDNKGGPEEGDDDDADDDMAHGEMQWRC